VSENKFQPLVLVFLIYSNYTFSSIEDYYPYEVEPSSSNYGLTGILELPNARFMEEVS
jgi:hypothetical protein